ncbi:MAG: phosphatidate cytidylyltransferase, partial [Candidatus Omnitrophica bacterium]|nr:phosphatidate cytidylyltransferase [Candidatus Omnitrophota bacterium]
LKRNCARKDSGLLLADMGGILDVIDSLLFTVPVMYLYLVGF